MKTDVSAQPYSLVTLIWNQQKSGRMQVEYLDCNTNIQSKCCETGPGERIKCCWCFNNHTHSLMGMGCYYVVRIGSCLLAAWHVNLRIRFLWQSCVFVFLCNPLYAGCRVILFTCSFSAVSKPYLIIFRIYAVLNSLWVHQTLLCDDSCHGLFLILCGLEVTLKNYIYNKLPVLCCSPLGNSMMYSLLILMVTALPSATCKQKKKIKREWNPRKLLPACLLVSSIPILYLALLELRILHLLHLLTWLYSSSQTFHYLLPAFKKIKDFDSPTSWYVFCSRSQ